MSDVDAGWADRYRSWCLGTARLRAEVVVRLDDDLTEGALAVLDPTYPRSYDSNKLVLPGIRGAAAEPAVVMAVADDVLGDEGLAHRYVSVHDAVPDGWAGPLLAAGWTQESLAGMACDVGSPRGRSGPLLPVVEVEEARAAVFVAATWREDEPGFDDETVRQLVRRRRRLDRAGSLQRLAVEAPPGDDAPGGLAALADLVVRGTTAELDAVGTLTGYRGRGYGDALVAAAQQRAHEAGADLLVLQADAGDWPRDWYARRGFVEVSASATLMRVPTA